MGAVICNVSKGKVARHAELPLSGDKFVWVLFTGSETDDNIRDAVTLTAEIATSLNEATFTGYSRQDAVGVTVATDNTNNWTTVDITTDPSWSPTSAEALTRIGLFYDPDGTNTAGSMLPLFFDDFAFTTPTSGTISYLVASGGFYKAS